MPLLLSAVFTARCIVVQSAVLRCACRPSVCPSVYLSLCLSVTLVDQDHIGWKSWKLIMHKQLATQHPLKTLLSQERVKLQTSNYVRTFTGSIATKALYRAHRTVIFAIAQLSCNIGTWPRPFTFCCSRHINQSINLFAK